MNRAIDRYKPTRLALMLGSILTASAAPALAADAAGQDGMGEIVVTAQKRAENAQDVPISIQSMSSDALAKIGAARLQDIEFAAPSLSFGDGSEQGRTGIRGIIDYSRSAGYDSRVGIYVDGVYYSRSWMNNQTLLGISQVDVLRGPQGTLFGKNTDAGVIAISTIRPSRELNGQVEAEVGNFGLTRFAGRVNVPLSDAWAFQIAATKLDSDGYYRNTLLDKKNMGVDSAAVRGQLRFHPDSDVDLLLTGDYADDDNTTLHYTYKPAAGTDPYSFRSYYDDHAARRSGGLSLSADFGLAGGFDLTAISAWRKGRQIIGFNNETGATPFLTARFNALTEQFSQELRIASPKWDVFDFVAGLYYFHQKNNDRPTNDWGVGVGFFPAPLGAYAGRQTRVLAIVSTDSYGAFVHANVRVTDRIELTGGMRYTWEKKSLDNLTTYDPLGALNMPLNGYSDDFGRGMFTPKGGINFKVNRDLLLFASVGRGFKSGGFNVEATSATQFATGLRFRPETVTSYEAGMKAEFLDRKARLNVTGFYQKFKDFQVFTFTNVQIGGVTYSTTSLSNAGAVTSKGIESEFTLAPVEGLTLSATYTYNISKFTRYPGGGGSYNGALLDADGVQTPYAPKHKAYLAADYSTGLFSWADASAHFGYSMQSSQNFDPKVVNPLYHAAYFLPSYDLADARIGLSAPDGGAWSVSFWSKNLFDKQYLKFVNRTALLGTAAVLYGEPRSYGATLRYKF